jgi:hypothetical protein
MTMKRFVLFAVALAAALAASAQIYQWQDEKDQTVISDRPPSGPARQQRKIEAPAPPDAPAGKTLAERELEFRKRQQESREAAEKAEKEQRASAQRKENCDVARNSLRALESGEPVVMRDSKGEAYYLDDAQRAQQIARARQAMQNNCR